jgi:predicted MPP superfamily phosphohydrolase
MVLLAVGTYHFLDASILRRVLPRAALSVERVSVPIHGLPQRLRNLKVIQLTDVHASRAVDVHTRGTEFSASRSNQAFCSPPSYCVHSALWAQVVAIVEKEKPDLVVVTGDIVDVCVCCAPCRLAAQC